MNLAKLQDTGQQSKINCILYTNNEQLEIENTIYNDIKKYKSFSLDLHIESYKTLLREIKKSLINRYV